MRKFSVRTPFTSWASRVVAVCVCVSLAALPLLAGCSSQTGSGSASSSSGASSDQASVDIATLEARAQERFEDLGLYQVDKETWKSFAANTVSTVLSGGTAGDGDATASNGSEEADSASVNSCFSPASLFFALALLTEGADGQAQQQLLELLGAQDTEELAVFCTEWMNQLTDTQENAQLDIANSVWANEGYAFKNSYLSLIDASLDATADTVKMGSTQGDESIIGWIKDATKDLIDPKIQTSADMVSVLVNAIYFKDSWLNKFMEENTSDAPFHAEGGDVEVPFMHRSDDGGSYAEGGNFTAALLPFSGGGSMKFFLPNDGVSVGELLADSATVNELLSTEFDKRTVNWSLPKFTIDSSFKDLVDSLIALGITDVFDGDIVGMFGPMLEGGDESNFYVSDAIQETHIALDEDGVEAAAYTAIMMKETAMLDDRGPVDFVLDRPFVYTVESPEGVVLFMGVVNIPEV